MSALIFTRVSSACKALRAYASTRRLRTCAAAAAAAAAYAATAVCASRCAGTYTYIYVWWKPTEANRAQSQPWFCRSAFCLGARRSWNRGSSLGSEKRIITAQQCWIHGLWIQLICLDVFDITCRTFLLCALSLNNDILIFIVLYWTCNNIFKSATSKFYNKNSEWKKLWKSNLQ